MTVLVFAVLSVKSTNVSLQMCLSLAEGVGGGDRVKEWGDPRPERLSENNTAGEGSSQAKPDPAGDSETERTERQGEGAQQEGVELKNTHTQ